MKKYLLLILVLLSACQNDKKQKAAKIQKPLSFSEKLLLHVDSLENLKDTIFLDFVLGSSPTQVNSHLNKLVKSGKTRGKETLIFSLMGSSMELTGYPYIIYLEDKTELPCLFDFKYLNNKLFAIDIQVYKNFDVEKVKNLLNGKYGNYDNVTTKESGKTYYWVNNNTEIEVAGSVFGDIQYFDLKKKIEYESNLKQKKKIKNESGLKNTKKDI
jgi:hypothetical protein